MNQSDTKSVNCITCGRLIGEVDNKATIVLPRCGDCSAYEEDDVFSYLANRFERSVENLITVKNINK